MWDPTPKSPGAGGVCSLTVPPHSVPDILVPLPDRTETGRHKIVTNGSRGSPSMVPAAAAVSYARPAGDPSPGPAGAWAADDHQGKFCFRQNRSRVGRWGPRNH